MCHFLFNKVAGLRPAILLEKRLWHRCFPANFAKFRRTHSLQNTPGRLLLNVNLIQDFWQHLKIPFLVKTKVKLGQMNWWAKLTNNFLIDSLYNFQNKPSLLSQWKLPCSAAASSFSSRDFSRSETSSIVKKYGAKIGCRTVASKWLCVFLFSVK